MFVYIHESTLAKDKSECDINKNPSAIDVNQPFLSFFAAVSVLVTLFFDFLNLLHIDTLPTMHMSTILSTILVALCCIQFTSAISYGIDCQCTCCLLTETKTSPCKPLETNSIHLDHATCDAQKCRSACNREYPFCERGKALMQTTCNIS